MDVQYNIPQLNGHCSYSLVSREPSSRMQRSRVILKQFDVLRTTVTNSQIEFVCLDEERVEELLVGGRT